MPKIVDHEVRRTETAEAFWRVVARQGIEGANIRAVAAEAGWSRGIVEHYFENKEELVLYACRRAIESTLAETRLRHEVFVGRKALRAVLLDCLASQSQEVWFELLSLAGREPALAAELVRFDAEISAVIAEIIAEMIASRGGPRRRRRGAGRLRLQCESQGRCAHAARGPTQRGRRGPGGALSRRSDEGATRHRGWRVATVFLARRGRQPKRAEAATHRGEYRSPRPLQQPYCLHPAMAPT